VVDFTVSWCILPLVGVFLGGGMSEHDTIIGQSPVFLNVLEQVSRLADLSRPVLVVGERGTGKELVARRLHYLSSRWQEPFLKVNCAALADSLLESDLFGHEAGAFTGAMRQRKGRFERAGRGTLFLDEIASMSGRLQEKLLRVVEYGEFERLGGDRTQVSRARVVGATNQDLPGLAAQGKFRPDLLDRLSFAVITLPPLRERREDILALAEHFALAMTREMRRPYFAGFQRSARETLETYQWPGNVRELKNVVERAVAGTEPGQPVRRLVLDPFASPYRPVRSASSPVRAGKEEETDPDGTFLPADFKAHIREQEKVILNRALAACHYNRRQAARRLGLSYDQLRHYLKKHGLGRGK